jgi:hypothetical protein
MKIKEKIGDLYYLKLGELGQFFFTQSFVVCVKILFFRVKNMKIQPKKI